MEHPARKITKIAREAEHIVLLAMRQDEIGTPYCITVDFATVGDDKTPADNAVTIRESDSMEQVRVPISELKNWLAEHTKF